MKTNSATSCLCHVRSQLADTAQQIFTIRVLTIHYQCFNGKCTITVREHSLAIMLGLNYIINAILYTLHSLSAVEGSWAACYL